MGRARAERAPGSRGPVNRHRGLTHRPRSSSTPARQRQPAGRSDPDPARGRTRGRPRARQSPATCLRYYARVFKEFDPADRRPAEEVIREAHEQSPLAWHPLSTRKRPMRPRERRRVLVEGGAVQGVLVKPSAGLEPATPSLPWRIRRLPLARFPGKSCPTRCAQSCAFCGASAGRCSPGVPRCVCVGCERATAGKQERPTLV
jgi:hypothetical protein